MQKKSLNIEEILSTYREQGFIKLEKVLSAEKVNRFKFRD